MKRRMLLALAASATAHAEPPAGGVERQLPENGGVEGGPRPRGTPRRRRSSDGHARGLKMHNEYLADSEAEPEPDAEADEGSEGAVPEAPAADAHGGADEAFEARDPPEAPAMEDTWRRAKSGKSEAAKAAKEEEEDPFHWNEGSSADENGSGAVGDGSWIHGDDEPDNYDSPLGKSGKSSDKDAHSNDGNSGSGKPNDNGISHSNGEDSGWNHHEDDAGWGHDVQAKLFKRPKSSKAKAAKSKSRHGPRPPPTHAPTPLDTPPGGYPSLTWLGVNGCTPAAPCGACTGDCDADADCAAGLECFHRIMDEGIPGCAPGGPGDVPGADYCVPPNPSPSRAPSAEGTLHPTLESGDLVWRGVNGCTPDEPCDACEGDCDADADCRSSAPNVKLACFKRADGEGERIPGCNEGGEGDIPGADYCYDVGYDATPSGMPTTDGGEVEAYFIRSQAGGGSSGLAVERSGVVGGRGLQQGLSGVGTGWCISGALAPAYSQLLLEPCTPDTLTTSNNSSNIADNGSIVARMERMDQLWHMDPYGHIRSIWDDENCMLVPLDSVDHRDPSVEAPVEVGPCGADNVLTEFYREDESRGPNVLKLQGYADLCVTFKAGDARKGAPLIVTPCGTEDRYGWDFVSEADVDRVPTPTPIGEGLPRMRYRGRNACTPETPCDVCAGDCDVDADCAGGLACFQRARDDRAPVPGCAAGGPGDVAGADYCFDPDGGGGDAPGSTAAPTPAGPLRWRGAGGCTPAAPCAACAGDCDEDGDCRGALACFRRPVGRSTPVPGCAAGGAGDVPGGDYCHDPERAEAPPAPAVPKQSPLPDEDLDLLRPQTGGTDAPTPSEMLDLSMSMPESDESEPPAMKPTEEQTTPPPSHGDTGKPSPSPVAASAPLPAKVRGKSSKGSKSSKGLKWSSSPRSSSGQQDGWSGTFEVERERAHRVREGTTRTERTHAEEEAAAEGDEGRTRQRGSTRWEREHDAEA